jgi:hypothetical protein
MRRKLTTRSNEMMAQGLLPRHREWLLGFLSGYTIGACIRVLLVVAIVLLLVGVVSGRRTI